MSNFYQFQRPWELRRLAVETQRSMSDEAFLSHGGDFEQKVQEALVGATFSSGFDRMVSSVLVRMARIHKEALDMEVRSADGRTYPFEITTAYPPDYKIQLAYRDGKRPEIPWRAFSGEPIPAEWIVPVILNKTNKVRGKDLYRHLLVYQNIAGGSPDLRQLKALCAEAESVWASVWLISGVPDWGGIALLVNRHGFACPEMKWLSYVYAPKGNGFGGVDLYLQ